VQAEKYTPTSHFHRVLYITPRLDVDIQAWNSELETTNPNSSVWMVMET
jgi:hypothetical protein